MTVKLLLLILALALLTVTSLAQDDYRPRKKDLSWGVKADGLRMTVWTNPATDKVFGAVRNFSSKKVCYCKPLGNNFTIYARKKSASQWQEIPLRPEEIKKGTVVILPICHAITLKPNEEIPPPTSPKRNYSFSVDLREYSFPVDWYGIVELKIVQANVYCHNAGNNVGNVESQAIKIKLPFTEAAAQR